MFFYVQGPNKHDLMPLERIFDRRNVKKTDAIDKAGTVDTEQVQFATEKKQHSYTASYVYQSVDKLSEDRPALFAYQVMTTPVITLTSSMAVEQALKLFQQKRLRHLPVVSTDSKVIGIFSDRDILQYMASMQLNCQVNTAQHTTSDSVELVMQSPVLTASEQTDIRYIARLFVEQGIGAVPIVNDGVLKGMITRSDILHAVMKHYEFELWI